LMFSNRVFGEFNRYIQFLFKVSNGGKNVLFLPKQISRPER